MAGTHRRTSDRTDFPWDTQEFAAVKVEVKAKRAALHPQDPELLRVNKMTRVAMLVTVYTGLTLMMYTIHSLPLLWWTVIGVPLVVLIALAPRFVNWMLDFSEAQAPSQGSHRLPAHESPMIRYEV
jgi:hypothetical protein